MDTCGRVVKIQKYTLHDGSGIRIMVFLKGCPMRCSWCSNPETQERSIELTYDAKLCIGCKSCIAHCNTQAITLTCNSIKIDRNLCNHCGACTEPCPSEALNIVGRRICVDEIIEEVERDRLFYSDLEGGAITFSGGEPMLQFDFLKQVLIACQKNGIDTAIETCGFAPWEYYQSIIPYTNCFFFDLKHMNSEIHKKLTAVDNKCILENLKKLAVKERTYELWVRFPLIPGLNDDDENLSQMVQWISSQESIDGIDILPFHQMGRGKYKILDKDYLLSKLKVPNEVAIQRVCVALKKIPFPVKLQGNSI